MPRPDVATESYDVNPNVVMLHVTKTVATIVRGNGSMHPVEAAFQAVCEDDSEGRYEFSWGGMRTILTVERQPDNSNATA